MKEKPHYYGHRQRLRDKFDKTGADGLHEYELLEVLLSYAIPRRDVKPIAKTLLKKFGSIPEIIDADKKELKEITGIGIRSATLIKLIKEFTHVYLAGKMVKRDCLKSPDAVIDFSRAHLAGKKNEVLMAVYVNSKNIVRGYEIIQEGTVDRAAVFPRKVMEKALSYKANGIILVHNHPSGDCNPSEDDKKLTRDIAKAGELLDIRLVDHLIVGKSGYYSFIENGIL